MSRRHRVCYRCWMRAPRGLVSDAADSGIHLSFAEAVADVTYEEHPCCFCGQMTGSRLLVLRFPNETVCQHSDLHRKACVE